jgi:hypothetical protein
VRHARRGSAGQQFAGEALELGRMEVDADVDHGAIVSAPCDGRASASFWAAHRAVAEGVWLRHESRQDEAIEAASIAIHGGALYV